MFKEGRCAKATHRWRAGSNHLRGSEKTVNRQWIGSKEEKGSGSSMKCNGSQGKAEGQGNAVEGQRKAVQGQGKAVEGQGKAVSYALM